MPFEMTMRDALIYAKFLQKGDVFRETNGRPGAPNIPPKPARTILEIRDVDDDELFGECNPPVMMHIKTDEGQLVLKEGVVVELLHRPQKDDDAYRQVAKLLAETYKAPDTAQGDSWGSIDRRKFAALREALEAHDLAKPYEQREKAASR